MSDFYITLVSNAETNDFIGDFKSFLPKSINLHGAYEVALTSIIYPGTHHVLSALRHDKTTNIRDNEIIIECGGQTFTVTIPPFSFLNGTELVDMLNYAVHKTRLLVTNSTLSADLLDKLFVFNTITKRCEVPHLPSLTSITLSVRLSYILGIRPLIDTFPYTGEHIVNNGSDFMFVYLNNLIEPQILSHSKVPVVKILSLAPGNGSNVDITISKPHYVPLRTGDFDHIHVQLKNDRNDVIEFDSGKVAIVLHFRKRRSVYYDTF